MLKLAVHRPHREVGEGREDTVGLLTLQHALVSARICELYDGDLLAAHLRRNEVTEALPNGQSSWCTSLPRTHPAS